MALITCPDCKRQLSAKADVCPQCGRPIARIKKTKADAQAVVGCAVIVVLSLACLGTGLARVMLTTIGFDMTPSAKEFIQTDYGRDPRPEHYPFRKPSGHEKLTPEESDAMIFWQQYCLDRQALGQLPDLEYYISVSKPKDVPALMSAMRKSKANQEVETTTWNDYVSGRNEWVKRVEERRARREAMSPEEWSRFSKQRRAQQNSE